MPELGKNLRFVLTLEDRFSNVSRGITQSSESLSQSTKKLAETVKEVNRVSSENTSDNKQKAAALKEQAAATEQLALATTKEVSGEKSSTAALRERLRAIQDQNNALRESIKLTEQQGLKARQEASVKKTTADTSAVNTAAAMAAERALAAEQKREALGQRIEASKKREEATLNSIKAKTESLAASTKAAAVSVELTTQKTVTADLKITAEKLKQESLTARIAAAQEKAAKATQQQATAAGQATKNLQAAAGGVGGTGGIDLLRLYSFGSLATQLAGLYTSLRAISFPIEQAGEFERSLATVKAIADASDESFKTLASSLLEMGYNTEFSAVEATKAAQAFAAAGYKVNELIGPNFNAIETTLKLAQVGMMDTNAAAEILIRTLSSFGIPIENIDQIANALTVAANETNVSVNELSTSLAYVAPIAGTLGMTLEEVVGPLAMLSNYGIKGSMAGTALRGTLSALINPTKEEAKLLESLGNSIGQASIKIWDAQGRFAGIPPILKQMEDAGMSVGEAMEIFGDRAGTGFAALMKEGSDSIGQFITKLETTRNALNAAAGVIGTNTVGDWRQFIASINAAAISIGSTFLPSVSALLQTLNEGVDSVGHFVEANKTLLTIMASLVTAVGSAALALKAFSAIKGLGKWLLSDLILTSKNMIGLGAAATTTATEVAAVGAASTTAAAEVAVVGTTSTAAAAGTVTLGSAATALAASLGRLGGIAVIIAGIATAMSTLSDIMEHGRDAFDPENNSLFKWLETSDWGKQTNLMFQQIAAGWDKIQKQGGIGLSLGVAVKDMVISFDLDRTIADLEQQIQEGWDNITLSLREGQIVPQSAYEDLEKLETRLDSLKKKAAEIGTTPESRALKAESRQNKVNSFADDFNKSMIEAAAKAMNDSVNALKEKSAVARKLWSEAYDEAAKLSTQLNNLKNQYDSAADAAQKLVAVDSTNMKQALKNMWDNVFTGPDISAAEASLAKLKNTTIQSEQERATAVEAAEAKIRDLRINAVTQAASQMESLLSQASSRELAIIKHKNDTEIQLIKNAGLSKTVENNKLKAQEESYAKQVADLAAQVAQKKKEGYETALKAAKDNLDAIYAKEKSIADQINKLQKDKDDSNRSANSMIRDLERGDMSAVDAYNDKMAEVNDTIAEGANLMKTDYAAGLALLKQAQSAAKGLGSAISDGEEAVVSQTDAVRNAVGLIEKAQDAINSGVSEREGLLKNNLSGLESEASATEKVVDTYKNKLQELQNNQQLMVSINIDFNKADQAIQDLTKQREAIISVSVDAAEAKAKEEQLKKELEGIQAKITANLDKQSADQVLANAKSLLKDGWKVEPVIDSNNFITGVKYMKDGYDEFATRTLKEPIKVQADMTEAEKLKQALLGLSQYSDLKITSNATAALTTVEQVDARMKQLVQEKSQLELKVNDTDAQSRIKEIDSDLGALQAKKTELSVKISTNIDGAVAEADQGIQKIQTKAESTTPTVAVGFDSEAPKMALAEIEEILNETLPDTKEIELRMKDSDFLESLDKASETVKDMTGIDIDVRGTDDIDALIAAYDQLRTKLKEELSLGVKANPDKVKELESALEGIKTKLGDLSGEELEVVDSSTVKDVEKVGKEVEEVQDTAEDGADLELETKEAEKNLKDVQDTLEEINDTEIEPKITPKVDADKAKRELDELSKDREMTLTVKVKKKGSTEDKAEGGEVEGFAEGGHVFKRIKRFIPGNGQKDDVPAMLMKGEYVLKKDAVRKYGVGTLDKINNGELALPRFAKGGFVNFGHMGRKLKYLMNPTAPITHNGVTYQLNHPTFINSVQDSMASLKSDDGMASASLLTKMFNAAIPQMATGGMASSAALGSVTAASSRVQQKYSLKIRHASEKGQLEIAQLYMKEAATLKKLALEYERTLRQIREELAETLKDLADELKDAKGEQTENNAEANEDYQDALSDIAEEKATLEQEFAEKLTALRDSLENGSFSSSSSSSSKKSTAASLASQKGLKLADKTTTSSSGGGGAIVRVNRNALWRIYDQQKAALDTEKERALTALEAKKAAALKEKNNAMATNAATYNKAVMENKQASEEAATISRQEEQDARDTYQQEVAATKAETKMEAETISMDMRQTIESLKQELAEALEELKEKAAEASKNSGSSNTTYSGSNSGARYWLNSGGYVPKSAGQAGVDSVSAMLTPGEMVIREPVVSALGRGFFELLNAGKLNKGASAAAMPYLGKLDISFDGGTTHNIFAEKPVADALYKDMAKLARRVPGRRGF